MNQGEMDYQPAVAAQSRAGLGLLLLLSRAMPWLVFFAVCTLSASLPESLDPTPERLGWLAGSFFLPAALLSAWATSRVQKKGPRHVLVLAFLTTACSLALISSVPTLGAACAGMAFGGIALAFAQPASRLAAVAHSDADMRPWMLLTVQAGMPVAAILAGAVLPPQIGHRSWTSSLSTWVPLVLFMALLVRVWIPPDDPRDRIDDGQREAHSRRRTPWLLALTDTLIGTAFAICLSWLGLYASRMGMPQNGMTPMMIAMGGAGLAVLGGLAWVTLSGSETLFARYPALAPALMLACGAAAIALLPLATTDQRLPLWAGAAGIGIALFASHESLIQLLSPEYPPDPEAAILPALLRHAASTQSQPQRNPDGQHGLAPGHLPGHAPAAQGQPPQGQPMQGQSMQGPSVQGQPGQGLSAQGTRRRDRYPFGPAAIPPVLPQQQPQQPQQPGQPQQQQGSQDPLLPQNAQSPSPLGGLAPAQESIPQGQPEQAPQQPQMAGSSGDMGSQAAGPSSETGAGTGAGVEAGASVEAGAGAEVGAETGAGADAGREAGTESTSAHAPSGTTTYDAGSLSAATATLSTAATLAAAAAARTQTAFTTPIRSAGIADQATAAATATGAAAAGAAAMGATTMATGAATPGATATGTDATAMGATTTEETGAATMAAGTAAAQGTADAGAAEAATTGIGQAATGEAAMGTAYPDSTAGMASTAVPATDHGGHHPHEADPDTATLVIDAAGHVRLPDTGVDDIMFPPTISAPPDEAMPEGPATVSAESLFGTMPDLGEPTDELANFRPRTPGDYQPDDISGTSTATVRMLEEGDPDGLLVVANPSVTQLITAHLLGAAAGPLALGKMAGTIEGLRHIWWGVAAGLLAASLLCLLQRRVPAD